MGRAGGSWGSEGGRCPATRTEESQWEEAPRRSLVTPSVDVSVEWARRASRSACVSSCRPGAARTRGVRRRRGRERVSSRRAPGSPGPWVNLRASPSLPAPCAALSSVDQPAPSLAAHPPRRRRRRASAVCASAAPFLLPGSPPPASANDPVDRQTPSLPFPRPSREDLPEARSLPPGASRPVPVPLPTSPLDAPASVRLTLAHARLANLSSSQSTLCRPPRRLVLPVGAQRLSLAKARALASQPRSPFLARAPA